MKDNPNFPNPPKELKTLESAVDEELRDYQAYIDCQKMVDRSYADRERWTTMSILNAARIGKFSSDRAIREYCRDIWQVEPVHVPGTPVTGLS